MRLRADFLETLLVKNHIEAHVKRGSYGKSLNMNNQKEGHHVVRHSSDPYSCDVIVVERKPLHQGLSCFEGAFVEGYSPVRPFCGGATLTRSLIA
jgi:hypothetical protein